MSQPKQKKGPMDQCLFQTFGKWVAFLRARPGQIDSKNVSDYQQEYLRNLPVLRPIFSELSISDLLNCRLVNKLWYSEVNSVMMTLDVALKISSEQPYEQVRQLIELIPQMSLPFNSLSFRKYAHECVFPCEIQQNTHDLTLELLRALPPIQYLHFDGSSVSKELIRKIMFANYGNLEKVSFDDSVALPTEILKATHELMNLKTIAPRKSSEFPEFLGYNGNVGTITEGCKSIEVVEDYTFNDLFEATESRFDLVKNLSFDSSYIMKPFFPHRKYTRFLEAKPALKSLTVTLKGDRKPPSFMSIIPDLVHLSKDTLTSVDFSPYLWGLLARGLLHFEPLLGIRELHKVPVNLSRMTSKQIANFGRFIAYMFPNLKSIEVESVDFEGESVGRSYDDVFVNGNGAGNLKSSSVTSVKLAECQSLKVSLSAVIHIAFPNVKNLNASLRRGTLQSVYDLWGEGPDLRSLTISAQVKSRVEIESELLGIFPQEVRRLRKLKLSPAQLKSLQVVPIRPALHHLSGLADLNIKIRLRRTGILLLQWNNQEVSYASDFDHNEIIKALSLGRMRSLKIAG